MNDRPASGRTGKVSPGDAARILADRDPVVARLVADAGLPRFPRPTDTHFATLVRSVTYQQLAGAAARAIHGRVVHALGDEVTPERLLATPTEVLRAAGLSGNKVLSLQDLAAKVLDGTVVLDPRRLARESDEDIVARLTTVRGIGKWSAEIFLMFQLRRLDVWPTGDLAVRKGFALAWSIPIPTPEELDVLGEPFHPYRSVVAWYCWRATQLYAGATPTAVTAQPGTGSKRPARRQTGSKKPASRPAGRKATP
jgi:DNA-3-methyladenine glycosylase II